MLVVISDITGKRMGVENKYSVENSHTHWLSDTIERSNWGYVGEDGRSRRGKLGRGRRSVYIQ
jgi:hypothetical protein